MRMVSHGNGVLTDMEAFISSNDKHVCSAAAVIELLGCGQDLVVYTEM